uniref:IS701 family transposase n=1 Tax=Rhodococcus tibetensis TaxID=2965064 RepID=UPI0035AC20FD
MRKERKNGWTLAEAAGDAGPEGMQRLLNFYSWDCEGLRDDVREVAVETIGDADKGVLIVDETGFLKKGTRSAGVARQYSGTAGRIENGQIGVFLAYASDRGRALIDRELYLPKAWTEDRDRRRAAGIDDEVAFATKPELAQTMIERALDAGMPFGWFTGDEAYGQVGKLRLWLESRGVAHVLAAEEVADGDLDGVAPAPSPRRDRRPADDRVAADQLRRRRPRPQGLRLGGRRHPATARTRSRALAAGAPVDHRPRRDCLLHLLWPRRHRTRRVGPGSRQSLGDRGVLPDRQERDRARPLPGARVPGLVPAHHLVDGRGRLPDDPAPRRSKRGSPAGTRDLIPLTINEIRRLFGPRRLSGATRPRQRLALVELAPGQSGQSARQPLQTSTSQTVVAVLSKNGTGKPDFCVAATLPETCR